MGGKPVMHVGLFWMEQWLKALSEANSPAGPAAAAPGSATGDEPTLEAEKARQLAARLEAELAELRAEGERAVAALDSRIAALAREVTDERAARTAVQAERDQANADLTDARRLSARLEAELAELRSEGTETIARHEVRIRDLARELAEKRDALDRSRQELTQAQATLAQVREAMIKAEAGLAERDTEIARLRQSVETAASSSATPAPVAADEPGGLEVHFRKPADWSEPVYLHFWNAEPPVRATAWPGVPMTPEGDGWYVHRLDGIGAASLVFNDGGPHKTGDLYRGRSGWLDADGRWSDRKPVRRR
ncbi:MAG: starch-binding protein [Rhodospirillales bacterium]|nr:MAG: starch-binding protein [Rhodospirillales bacterium]